MNASKELRLLQNANDGSFLPDGVYKNLEQLSYYHEFCTT